MAKTEFIVSIDVVTRGMSAKKLAAKLGVDVSPSSHSVGDPRGFRGHVWNVTVLRLDSRVDRARPLEQHLKRLLSSRRVSTRLDPDRLPKGCRACLNIGVFFRAAMSGLDIPARYLRRLAELDMDLEVSSYPCSTEERSAP